MNNIIALTEQKQEARVDSLSIAERLGVSHHAVIQMIDKNADAFKILDRLAFEMRVVSKKGAGQATRFALLTEDQAYFLLTLSRNSKRVVELKLNLVQAFGRFRRDRQTAVDYLPFYHDLHDAIKALTEHAHTQGSRKEEAIFHLMYNKLINKACGIEELGVIAFQTRKPPKGSQGGRPETFVLLSEDQSYLLLSFSRNIKKQVNKFLGVFEEVAI